MTLLLGMARPEGVYVSVDHRLTYSHDGSVAEDTATKHVVVHYPPIFTGPKALISYTGLAFAPDGTPTAQWIRETIRGEQLLLPESMEHLVSRLDRDFGPTGQPLIVNLLVVEGDRRFWGVISNYGQVGDGDPQTHPEFYYNLGEEPTTLWVALGSGAYTRGMEGLTEPIRRQLNISPRRPSDYMHLLAGVNRSVAARNRTVSPHCHAAFLPCASTKFEPQNRIYTERDEFVPFTMPFIFAGIDTTDMASALFEQAQTLAQAQTAARPDVNPELNSRTDQRP